MCSTTAPKVSPFSHYTNTSCLEALQYDTVLQLLAIHDDSGLFGGAVRAWALVSSGILVTLPLAAVGTRIDVQKQRYIQHSIKMVIFVGCSVQFAIHSRVKSTFKCTPVQAQKAKKLHILTAVSTLMCTDNFQGCPARDTAYIFADVYDCVLGSGTAGKCHRGFSATESRSSPNYPGRNQSVGDQLQNPAAGKSRNLAIHRLHSCSKQSSVSVRSRTFTV